MAYKKIQSLDADKSTAVGGKDKKTGKTNPKQVEGYYLGKRTVKGTRGDSTLHFIQTAEGNLGVWGKTDMNRKLSSATPGAMTKITHVGMTRTPNGDMYKYDVEQDDSNVIDVSSLTADDTTDTNDLDDGDGDSDSGYQSGYGEEAGDDEVTEIVRPSVAARSASDRKAAVEALLKGNKKN